MNLEDNKKSIQFPKDIESFKDIKIIIIDQNTYYDSTNDIFYKVIKSY